jgi:hypothetical protein
MPTPDTEEQTEALHAAEKELKTAQSADDVRTIWRKYYLAVGHRKLGRLLIGRTAEQILAGRQKD